MKKILAIVSIVILQMTMTASFAQSKSITRAGKSTVYFVEDITPESLIKIYEALGREAKGKVAVKISTGEQGGNNYLKPKLIKNLVKKIKGTIVECIVSRHGTRILYWAQKLNVGSRDYELVHVK